MANKKQTLTEIARVVGVERSTVSHWKKRGKLDNFILPDGSYDTESIVANIHKYLNPSNRENVCKRWGKKLPVSEGICLDKKMSEKRKVKAIESKRKKISICGVCNKVFLGLTAGAKFCSIECSHQSQRDFTKINHNLYWVMCRRCKEWHKITSWRSTQKEWKCERCRKAERISRCHACGKIFSPKIKSCSKFCSHRCADIDKTGRDSFAVERESARKKAMADFERTTLGDNYIKRLLTDSRKRFSLSAEKIKPELIEMYRAHLTVRRELKQVKEILNGTS